MAEFGELDYKIWLAGSCDCPIQIIRDSTDRLMTDSAGSDYTLNLKVSYWDIILSLTLTNAFPWKGIQRLSICISLLRSVAAGQLASLYSIVKNEEKGVFCSVWQPSVIHLQRRIINHSSSAGLFGRVHIICSVTHTTRAWGIVYVNRAR